MHMPSLVGHQKRKRSQFESDCESMGDNFHDDDFLRNYHNRNRRVVTYIWTDNRVQLLVNSFYGYVVNPDSNIRYSDDKHELLLEKLRKELLTLAVDNDIRGSPTVNDITEKLNDLALCFKNKYARYFDLKEILGKDMREKFRVLVRHHRFDDYVKPGCTPQCVTYSNSLPLLSRHSTSFYWTDKRLQHLVISYYLLLDNLKSDSSGQSCLTTLKRKLGWDVTVPVLRSMLDKIFKDYEEKSFDHEEFKIRIGKDTCIFFDQLVNLEWNLYKKKDTTKSKSHGSSSRSKSFASTSSGRMSQTTKIQADADRIKNELVTSGLELNDHQIAILMIKLADENLRSFYWSCSAEQRNYFLRELLK